MYEVSMYEVSMYEVSMYEVSMYEVSMYEVSMYEVSMYEVSMYEVSGLAASHVLTIGGRIIFGGNSRPGVNNTGYEVRTSPVFIDHGTY